MSTSSASESISSPEVRSESRGSSVSTGLREEYDDLLRYAVVMPVLNTAGSGGAGPPASKQAQWNKTGDPTPRSSLPPRPHTPPKHASRSKMKAEGMVCYTVVYSIILFNTSSKQGGI